jgi:hypothetical protein
MYPQRTDRIVINNGTVISPFIVGNISFSKKIFWVLPKTSQARKKYEK